MTPRISHLTLTALLLGGMLTSCESFGNGKERQALLDHHLKLEALAAFKSPQNHIASSNYESANTESNIILPIGDPQPLIDDVDLAPDGPSKPFAADPVDEVGLFPED